VGVLATYLIGGFVLFPPTSDEMGEPIGNCFVLSSSWCTSLAVEQLEALSGVEFPAHAEVINSGSSGFLLTGHDWATVRWPEGTSVPEGLTSTRFRGEVSGGSDFAWIDASWTDLRERYETIVHVGVGTDGRPQLSLRRTWNG
jgi:uncharacterized protein YbdZ (MbtH family)